MIRDDYDAGEAEDKSKSLKPAKSLKNDSPIDLAGLRLSGVTYHDAQGRIYWANKTAQKILGGSQDQLKGRTFSDFAERHTPGEGDGETPDWDPIKIAAQTGEVVSNLIFKIPGPKGEGHVWLLVTAIPLVDQPAQPNGQVVCQIQKIPAPQGDSVKQGSELLRQFLVSLEPDLLANLSFAGFCEKVLQYLPQVLTHPATTHVRIILFGQDFSLLDFEPSEIFFYEDIYREEGIVGKVEFHYHPDRSGEVLGIYPEADKAILRMLALWFSPVSQIIEQNHTVRELKEEALTAYDRTIEAWSAALETQDKEASGHTKRVTTMVLAMAKEFGFEGEALVNIRRGALLHDIGKISIPDEIMLKPGKLTDEEYEIVKKHPVLTQKWLSQIELLKPALQIPYYHHERWDGTGYPQGLAGEAIPLEARMFAIVDVWDALTSDRPYRRAMSEEDAIDLILSESGTHFDPAIVDKFLELLSSGNFIDTPPEIKIKGFGQAGVWIKNRPVTSKDWQVYAARDLFFLFLANPAGLSKEQVGLEMWPDVTSDELDVRFKNTLYRLRRALGNDVILLIEGAYRFNKTLDYTYDVEAFVSKLSDARGTSTIDHKITLLEKAIRLYEGDYLPELDSFSIVTDRERYRLMYLEALVQVAELLFKQDDLRSANEFLAQALKEDAAFEDAYRLNMQIHAALGNRAEVVRQYEACCKAFQERFDVLPSKKTQALFQKLIQS